MSSFLKIVETISSKEKLYSTPFLNFEYKANSRMRKIKKDNSKALRGHLKDLESRRLKLEEEKENLNKKAFTEILTDEENNQLAEIFTTLEKNRLQKDRIEQQLKMLLND